MDEEGIAAVAVSGVVPRPLENYVLLFWNIQLKKCGYAYKFSAGFTLWQIMQCIPNARIYTEETFYPGRIIPLFVLNVLSVV